MRRALPLAALLVLMLAMAMPAVASATGDIRAVFLKEWDAEDLTYTINQGELATFRNEDPFFTHALSSQTPGLFSAEEIPNRQNRLVQGVPFLSAGSYPFEDPLHPEMVATLVVTGAGAPLPPDNTPPAATLKIKTHSAKKLLNSNKIFFNITPTEPVDVGFVIRAGNSVIKKKHLTYLLPGTKAVTMGVIHGRLKQELEAKRAKGKATIKLRVHAFLGDVAGNLGDANRSEILKVPGFQPGL